MSTKDYNDYWFHYVLDTNPQKIKEKIEERYILSKGNKIHLDVYKNEESGTKTIIFIHGTAVYSRFYAEFCYKLNKKGYRIIAPDLVGHGKSEGTRGHFTMESLTELISDVVSFVLQLYGEDIIIMGSSLGGITALYSVAYDERIKGAICHNAALFNEEAHEKIIELKGILKILKSIVPKLVKIFPKFRISVWTYLDTDKLARSDEMKHKMDLLIEDPLLSDKYTLTALNAQMKEAPKKPIENVYQPIMIINGDEDVLFLVGYMKEIYSRLPSEEKKLVILKDTSHLIFQENIDTVLANILPWLEKIL